MTSLQSSENLLASLESREHNYKAFRSQRDRNINNPSFSQQFSSQSPLLIKTTTQRVSQQMKNLTMLLSSPSQSQFIPNFHNQDRISHKTLQGPPKFFKLTSPDTKNITITDVKYIPNAMAHRVPATVHNAFPNKLGHQQIVQMTRSERKKVIRRQNSSSNISSLSHTDNSQKVPVVLPLHARELSSRTKRNKLLFSSPRKTIQNTSTHVGSVSYTINSEIQASKNYKSFRRSEERGTRPNSALINLYKGITRPISPGRIVRTSLGTYTLISSSKHSQNLSHVWPR